ncbi:MAG: SCO5918 family protein [Candidatus Micrarchaeaceae archaeon]
MEQTMSFTVGGKAIQLSRDTVETALKGVKPEPVKKYSVKIGGHDYPIKQVLSVASGVPTAAFISTDAYRVLSRLGFNVVQS